MDLLEALGARLITLLELSILIVVSYFVSGWIFGLIDSSGIGRNYAYLGQIISFFVILLAYYKLVRVKLNISFNR
ncbi:MAG TPA: hypothetical protein VJN71_05595 [Nitrososphaerales archaeon]|nr:hypothetical protein [Nitrososphaerales archaeon]